MNWLWDNIHLKKEERVGMFFFICILLILLAIKWYLVVLYVPQDQDYSADLLASLEYTMIESTEKAGYSNQKNAFASTKNKSKNKKKSLPTYRKKKAEEKVTLFVFDPNTLNVDSLKMLGLNNYVANNIQKYRAKGGYFKEATDLLRIYGMDSILFEKIDQYIKIKKIDLPLIPREENKKSITYSKPKIELESIDINRADTTTLKMLSGIGPVYANRIVKFRNSLGGYFTIDQIGDVWGISDSLFMSIKPYLSIDISKIEKKNINVLEKKELVRHPYIDWKKAKIILKYKKMHGDFNSMEDLRKMHGLTDAFVDTLNQYYIAE